MTGRDAVREQLAAVCEARWPGAISNADTVAALLPVVELIATQRAAAELRAAADEPDMYDVFIGHGVSADEVRRIADALDGKP